MRQLAENPGWVVLRKLASSELADTAYVRPPKEYKDYPHERAYLDGQLAWNRRLDEIVEAGIRAIEEEEEEIRKREAARAEESLAGER